MRYLLLKKAMNSVRIFEKLPYLHSDNLNKLYTLSQTVFRTIAAEAEPNSCQDIKNVSYFSPPAFLKTNAKHSRAPFKNKINQRLILAKPHWHFANTQMTDKQIKNVN
jgi:hypothetical protein